MTLSIKIKHAGKAYDVAVNLDQPGLAFKQQIHALTGVDPAKVKVVVKGGMLKVRRSALPRRESGRSENAAYSIDRTAFPALPSSSFRRREEHRRSSR